MKLAILKLKDAADIGSKIETDLNCISALLKSDDPTNFSTITFPSPEKMELLFNRIYELSLSQNTLAQSFSNKGLRLYLFLIDRHKTNIWHSGLADALSSLNVAIKNLSKMIGGVPRLSHQVVWADQKFLPPKINRSTKKKWQKQACAEPRRGQTVSENGVHFIGMPREALRERYSSSSVERIEASAGDLYLNLIDFDYYKLGLMDADHLLASASLLLRLQEMITAMNYDPEFAREMKNSIFNDDYFITNSDGSIVGNYWLYMAYHNSIENLWLLLASDNSSEKGAEDPLVWFSHLEVGKKYLQNLEEEGKHIDKSDILYRVSGGGMSMSLKDSFTSWIRESHRDKILVYHNEARLHQKMRESISHASDSRKDLMEVHGNIAVVSTHFFSSDTDSVASSFTSVSSSIAEPFAQQYVEAIAQDTATKILVRETKERSKEVGSEIKQNVKRQRFGT